MVVLELTDEERDQFGMPWERRRKSSQGVGVALADRFEVGGGPCEQGGCGGVWRGAGDGREVAPAVLRVAVGWAGG
jgi:hypothetical protein